MYLRIIAITILTGAFASTSCSVGSEQKEENQISSEDSDHDGSLFELKGSITSAFDVTVDGADYPDLETFYTEEVGRLPEKVAEQGYEGWDAKFDAKIGFTDLYSGMKLFAQSTSGRGYQAQGNTKSDGNFIINMPADAEGDTFKVRGVKRISILLSKDGETKKFCYNFGPQDSTVPYGERDKPIIMSSFTTRITAYECAQVDSSSGLEIPQNTDPNAGSGPGAPSGTESRSSGSGSPTLREGAVYNFSNTFAVTPSGCSAVDKVEVFGRDSRLVIFVKANCGSRSHVYSYQASYAGISQSSPVLISGSCNSGSVGVKNFAVDQGNAGFLLAYTCQPSSGSVVTYVAPLDGDGQAAAAVTVETGHSENYAMLWNADAGVYGLARSGYFQRYTEAGVAVGGPISLAAGTILDARIFSSSWYFYSQSPQTLPFASKVNKQGTLDCAGAYRNDTGYNVFLPLSENMFLSFSPNSNGGYGAGVNRRPMSAGDCSPGLSDLSKSIQPKNYSYSDNLAFQTLSLSSGMSALLYKTRSSLMLMTVPVIDTFEIYGESSVAGFTSSLNHASARTIDGRIYVAYDKDGAGYISYGSEAIP